MSVAEAGSEPTPPIAETKRMSVFERYLTLWVALCMVAGVAIGRTLPQLTHSLRGVEFGTNSQINGPIAVLIWLMIVPMMMKIDFSSLAGVTRRPKGLLVTLFVNWLVKPFSMFALGWLFFQVLFLPLIGEELAKQYTAGVIILAAAPCTAMVFVWSYLTDGDPAYTLVQVAVNDLIMLVLFAPIVGLLVGVAGLAVPFNVILLSVAVFIVVPLAVGAFSRVLLVRAKGREWFDKMAMRASRWSSLGRPGREGPPARRRRPGSSVVAEHPVGSGSGPAGSRTHITRTRVQSRMLSARMFVLVVTGAGRAE